MADFDPSAYLAEKQAQAAPFDPAKYLAEKTAPVPAKPEGIDVGGIADAGLRGMAQGASLGFADEAAAGVGGLKDYIAGKLGLRGDISLPDAYHTWRDVIRNADAKAEAAHPAVYTGGQVAGGLMTAFAPGLGALNVGKGAGLVEAGLKGAAIGGLAGAGNAKEITDVPAEAGRGALVGGAVGGALNLGGRVISAVADKLRPAAVGSVLLNAPESALQRYIENPEAVNAARSRADIVADEFLPRLESLQNDAQGGSQASRAILASEGKTVNGSVISDIADAAKQKILDRSEGVLNDPRQMAAVKWLSGLSRDFKPEVIPGGAVDTGTGLQAPAQTIEKQLSTSRIKDLLQNFDAQTEYEVAPGQFARVTDSVKKDVRSQIDQLLKSESPAYTDQMKKVAADTALLGEVSDLARSPQGFDNLLKRTQRGSTPQLMDALQRFDQRTGGGLLQELQDSAAKDALERGAMNGSRNVNLHGNFGRTIGEAIGGLPGRLIGEGVGYLGGATVDKYGPAMSRGLVDSAAATQSFLDNSPAVRALGTYVQPLLPLATGGNRAAAIIDTLEAKNQKKDAIRRRIGE